MVVLIAALGFSAHLAIRLIGSRKGLLLTAVLGGLVSSTVTDPGAPARAHARRPVGVRPAGTSALMFPRILVEIGAIHPALLGRSWPCHSPPPPSSTWRHAVPRPARPAPARRRPTSQPAQPLRTAPGPAFRRLLSAILLLVEGRPAGCSATPASMRSRCSSGLADVDAITCPWPARRRANSIQAWPAGIALAALSNSLVKAGLVALVGGKRLVLQTPPFSLAGLLVGALLILL